MKLQLDTLPPPSEQSWTITEPVLSIVLLTVQFRNSGRPVIISCCLLSKFLVDYS